MNVCNSYRLDIALATLASLSLPILFYASPFSSTSPLVPYFFFFSPALEYVSIESGDVALEQTSRRLVHSSDATKVKPDRAVCLSSLRRPQGSPKSLPSQVHSTETVSIHIARDLFGHTFQRFTLNTLSQ